MRKQHLIIINIIFLLLGISYAGNLSAKQTFSTQEQLKERISEVCFLYPDSALNILNETKTLNSLPKYLANYLRCLIYHNGLGMYSVALNYGEKALEDENIYQDPYVQLSLYDMMMEEYRTNSEYTKGIQCALNGIDIARQLKEVSMEGNMLLFIGTLKREIGLKAEAETYFRQATEKLRETASQSHE